MFPISEKDADFSARLAHLLSDARASDFAMTIAVLEFATFTLKEDLKRHQPKSEL